MNIFDILIVQPIFNLLIVLYAIIPGADFGVALIIFTILVRLALWPLVKKQLHQTRMMQKLQPELAKIKKNSGGDRRLESAQMLELYKKNGVSMFRSFGILAIQIPIFIALYQVIMIFTNHLNDVAKYTYDFLQGMPAINNLISDPSSFNEMLFGVVDLTATAVGPNGINIALIGLALIAAYTQRVLSKQVMPKNQQKRKLKDILAEAADGKDASQSEINNIVMGKMMTFLPIIMFIVMINLPGALALYYAVSNVVAVIQQSRVLKKDTDEMEVIAEDAVESEAKTAKSKSSKAKSKKSEKSEKTAKSNVTRIVAKDSRKGKK